MKTINRESAAAALKQRIESYKDQPVAEAMIQYVVGRPALGPVEQMQFRCYRLAEILGSMATPLGEAYLKELTSAQPSQRDIAVSLLDHLEARLERKLTHDEANLFNAIGQHMNQDVEGLSPTESISLNFSTAMHLVACFIAWASEAQRAD
ncbi:MAG TPA: hypothetical protein V6C84_16135 [Coleofasciculaceae cyanobacterium]|jgi:hypothetical protein